MGRRGAARPAGLNARPRPRRAWPPAGQRAASPPPPPLRCAGAAPGPAAGLSSARHARGLLLRGGDDDDDDDYEEEKVDAEQTFPQRSRAASERAAAACGRSPGPRGLARAGLLAAEANHQRARLSAGRGPLLRGGERPRAQVAQPRGGAVGAAPCRQQQVAERQPREPPEVCCL